MDHVRNSKILRSFQQWENTIEQVNRALPEVPAILHTTATPMVTEETPE